LFFPPLLVITDHKSAEASFQRRFPETAINRARFDADQRPAIRKDKAVCAQLQPDTMSVGDPVKLFPTCRVSESLGVSAEAKFEMIPVRTSA
jgi:hypothetical protein